MKHIKLNEHSEECKEKKSIISGYSVSAHELCKMNPSDFLFTFNNDFIIITYHSCLLPYPNHLDIKEFLLKEIGLVKKDKWHIERSVINDDKKRNEIIRTANSRSKIEVINYIYNRNPEYCFTSKRSFINTYFNMELFTKNYNEALKYCNQNGYKHFIPDIEKLYRANYFRLTEVEEIKSIELLIKNIKNGNKRKSEHKELIKRSV